MLVVMLVVVISFGGGVVMLCAMLVGDISPTREKRWSVHQ